MAEDLARDRLKLFNAEYANVQPHSGSQLIWVYLMFLNHMDTVMGLDLAHGGHLTHGSKVNFQVICIILFHILFSRAQVELILMKYESKRAQTKINYLCGSAYPNILNLISLRNCK